MKTIPRQCPLKDLRAALDLSQEGLARLANVSISAVNRCEMGESGSHWKLSAALAEKLQITLDAANGICNGSISEADLQKVLKQVKKTRKGSE